MHIVFDYLMESDYAEPNYTSVATRLAALHPIRCTDYRSFANQVNRLGRLQEPSTITILSHGHYRGIAQGEWSNLIKWSDLISLISELKGQFQLTLNLLATCKSERILQNLPDVNNLIDVMWLTTADVISINYALLAVTDGFDVFLETLDDEDQELYRKWEHN